MGRVLNRDFLEAFQVADVAKCVMKGGGMLNWEQGLGKTIGAMLFAKAVGAKFALFICPQDIVPQWCRTASEKFLTDLRPISCAEDAVKLRRRMKHDGLTGWYITYFEALAQSGKVEEMSHIHWQKIETPYGKTEINPYTLGRRLPLEWIDRLGQKSEVFEIDGEEQRRELIPLTCCPRCGQTIDSDHNWLHVSETRDMIARHGRNTENHWLNWPGRHAEELKPLRRNVNWNWQTRPGTGGPRAVRASCSRCGYTHWSQRVKPAYYWLRDLFDCIVVDEGTKIKNMDSQCSQAVQGMKAKYRLLLTGTPIKNYITDMFPLMWWALGNNSPRFPFDRDRGRAKFESEFSVVEYVLNRHGRREPGRKKILPKVSNLVALWRLINAGCIRRTKKSSGVPIVPCHWHDIRAPFGTRQAVAYGTWLEHFPTWFSTRHPDSKIAGNHDLIKRNAALLGMFAKLNFMCTLPEAEPDHWIENVSNFTPKNVAVIQKTRELVAEGRKVVIFSAVKDHSWWMADVLNRLDIPALSIVEARGDECVTMGPKGRANLVKDFIEDGYPALCASIQAMNLGHNLDCASAVIINGLPWDFASYDQAINRVHRITSKRDVDVYIAQTVCNPDSNDFRRGASLDQKMWQLLKDKGESASLALDGELPERDETEVDVQQFLDDLSKQWREPIDTLDEESLRLSLLEAEALAA